MYATTLLRDETRFTSLCTLLEKVAAMPFRDIRNLHPCSTLLFRYKLIIWSYLMFWRLRGKLGCEEKKQKVVRAVTAVLFVKCNFWRAIFSKQIVQNLGARGGGSSWVDYIRWDLAKLHAKRYLLANKSRTETGKNDEEKEKIKWKGRGEEDEEKGGKGGRWREEKKIDERKKTRYTVYI